MSTTSWGVGLLAHWRIRRVDPSLWCPLLLRMTHLSWESKSLSHASHEGGLTHKILNPPQVCLREFAAPPLRWGAWKEKVIMGKCGIIFTNGRKGINQLHTFRQSLYHSITLPLSITRTSLSMSSDRETNEDKCGWRDGGKRNDLCFDFLVALGMTFTQDNFSWARFQNPSDLRGQHFKGSWVSHWCKGRTQR